MFVNFFKYSKILFISVMAKLSFQHHYSSLQCHKILQKSFYWFDSHSRYTGDCFKAGGVADEFVESIDDIREARPSVPIFLPAVEHQLVESSGTVHGGRQPVILLYSIDHLHKHTQTLLALIALLSFLEEVSDS